MISIRNMTIRDLEKVLDWAAEEGWNPGLDDAEAFFAADPQGFFVSEDNGEMVAAISVVNHNDKFAFLGLYLCRPSHRGRGIGYALWQHAIGHAGDRIVGLDGVPDQQDNYVKSGFAHAGETIRWSGQVTGAQQPGIRRANEMDIDALIRMEAAVSGWRKEKYLAAWFRNTQNRVTYVREVEGKIDGFCTARACRSDTKIGPLYATDDQSCLALLSHAASAFKGQLVIDVPKGSDGLKSLCSDLGFEPDFNTARMYRGDVSVPQTPFFAVTSLELG